ncbi:MAG: YihY/virulence factor BrkB family protein [Acetobacteraceae bacterium]
MSTQERIEDLKRDLEKLRYQQQPQAERATRGRDAEHPGKIPPGGWMDVLWRAWNEVSDANLFLVAGGVTYAVLLALFPGLAALVAIYGLILDPSQVERQVSALSGVLPEESKQLLIDELHKLISTSSGTLGLSAAFGLVLALWSASRGMSGLITSLNIAYEEKERRGFFKLNLLALGLTIALVLGGLVVIALVAVLPAAVQLIGLRDATRWLLLGLEWPLLAVVVMFGLAAIYRYAPAREKPQWRWVSPGAIAATSLWIIGSIAFTVYVANFNSYDKTYGSLGGVVILLTWLYLSAFVVLLGAAINAQSEKQTRRDSTDGSPVPMGRRGARAADTLGPSRP